MKNINILVVEDEIDIAKGIKAYLASQGYDVFIASNGKKALEIVENNLITLAIVDVMMPIMSGIDFVIEVRKTCNFPIIMLSAKTEEVDKILGLNVGADDYVAKPFKPLELLARVNSNIRRYTKYMPEQTSDMLITGGLELYIESKEVKIDGKIVKTTPIEFKILKLLMENQGRVFSSEEIYEKVWQEKAINTETIMVHIRKIREKIEINPKKPEYLKVVWGVGYKIEKK